MLSSIWQGVRDPELTIFDGWQRKWRNPNRVAKPDVDKSMPPLRSPDGNGHALPGNDEEQLLCNPSLRRDAPKALAMLFSSERTIILHTRSELLEP